MFQLLKLQYSTYIVLLDFTTTKKVIPTSIKNHFMKTTNQVGMEVQKVQVLAHKFSSNSCKMLYTRCLYQASFSNVSNFEIVSTQMYKYTHTYYWHKT